MTSETINKSAGECPIETIIEMYEEWARRASARTGPGMLDAVHAARIKLASLRAGIVDMHPAPDLAATSEAWPILIGDSMSRVDIIANHPAVLAVADQIETLAEELASLAQACIDRAEAADKKAAELLRLVLQLEANLETTSEKAFDNNFDTTNLAQAREDALRAEFEALKRRVVVLEDEMVS